MIKYLILFIFITSIGCSGDKIGAPCKTTGGGFTMSSNCASKCMSIWRITCPDGSMGNSNVCAGREGCSRGGCPENQVCYQTNIDRAFCVPQSICPGWEIKENHPKVELRELKSSKRKLKVTAEPKPL